MKNIVKVELSGHVEYFTPAAYKEWRLSLSTGDFHTHKAKRVKKAPRKSEITDLNTLLLEQLMPSLAKACGLTHDGQDDNRIFDEMITTNSLQMSEKEYKAMEKDINSFSIRGQDFACGAWNDSSGFNYWNKQQKENNYIQITVYIKDPRNVNSEDVRMAIRKARNHFAKYNLEFV